MKAALSIYHQTELNTLMNFTLMDGNNLIMECKALTPTKFIIPFGCYNVEHRYSEKFKDHFQIKSVHKRRLILFHGLNHYKQSRGCVGLGHEINNNIIYEYWITNSKNKLNELLRLTNKFELELK